MEGATYSDLELKLRQECERGFKVGPRTKSPLEVDYSAHPGAAFAPTGEPFVELTGRDIGLLSSDDECYIAALAMFRGYAIDRAGTLYWRIYPEIDRGRFYMRLLISDKSLLHSSIK